MHAFLTAWKESLSVVFISTTAYTSLHIFSLAEPICACFCSREDIAKVLVASLQAAPKQALTFQVNAICLNPITWYHVNPV